MNVWRHPQPRHVAGRCIGHTDVPVDPRRAKRLAHRIRQYARQHHCPPVIWTSALARSQQVGCWLKRWGWTHHIDPLLIEMNFGTWDGQRWDDIGPTAMDVWCAAFAHHRPGGAESLCELIERCQTVLSGPGSAHKLVVGHAGWINAARWSVQHPNQLPQAGQWPLAVGYNAHVCIAWSALAPQSAATEHCAQSG
jgi:alpha-ribazole phosphatase